MRGKKSEATVYEFRLEGQLDHCWSDWFEGLELHYETDEETNIPVTVLVGPVIDQSALHGILEKISNLNIKLQSVNEVSMNKKEGFSETQ